MRGTNVLYEDHVVDAVCSYLQADGWTIASFAHANQRGDDIVAVRGAERLVVEAKGAGASRAGAPRFGQPFTRNQVKSHVGVAVLRALTEASVRPPWSAIALPDNAHHRQIAGAAAVALARAGVGIFWVDDDHEVTAQVPWERVL